MADRCIFITGCNTGYYFYVPTNSCVAVCPNGYYADIFTGNCTECAGGCLTCYGSTSNQCNTCGVDLTNSSNTRYKKILIPSCVVDCPDGQYEETLGGYNCAKCHESCALCENNILNCSKCTNFTGIVYYLLSNQCLQICPDGYYGSPILNECVPCDDACLTCFGPTNLKCRSCKSFNGTDYFLSYGTTECIQVCLPGQYSNLTVHKCQVCDSNCKTCIGQAANCTSCYLNNGQYVFL